MQLRGGCQLLFLHYALLELEVFIGYRLIVLQATRGSVVLRLHHSALHVDLLVVGNGLDRVFNLVQIWV